jgi:hypothetical protein
VIAPVLVTNWSTHAAERLALHAAHKAEEGKLFNVIAGKVFALFERVPALAVGDCASTPQT